MMFVTGGRQRPSAAREHEWQRFSAGLIFACDQHGAKPLLEYQSPPEACPPGKASVLFKAGSLSGEELHVCTQTEIITYRTPALTAAGYLSLPFFNDLHHVAPTPWGTLLVAVTGLDMVTELSRDGRLLRCWDVLGDQPWERFSPAVDYRKVPTTKPHRSHPNYVFTIGDDVWVTRFAQRDAICLTRPELRIDIAVERPHDGCVHGDAVYFTTIDGHVVKAEPRRGRVLETWRLAEILGSRHPLGWCRSLKVLDEDVVVVGFSRLRGTAFTENLSWVKLQLGVATPRPKPTRLCALDLRRRELLWEVNLEELGMNAVFSVL